MGTRGCYIYRYRNMYFCYYRHYDSFPEGLGVKVLQWMRLPNAITTKQQELKEMLDEFDGQSFPLELDDGLTIFDRRVDISCDVDAEWAYGIDLDHNIFDVNGIPFYSLECLPEPGALPQDISEDHYHNLACSPECPPEERYKRPAAPVIDDSDLETYRSLACTGPGAALSDLLGISDILSTNEQVRVSLLEMIIGRCMPRLQLGQLIHEFDTISNHNQLTDDGWFTAYSVISFAFAPQIFDAPSVLVQPPEPDRKECVWVREDTVVCFAMHLDNERCLQASVSRLIESILEQRDAPGDYFGVAFSVSHCAIVKVIKDIHTTFSHTTALQFLPSFFAVSPSTPGITALARLGYRIDPALYVSVMKVWHGHEGIDVWRKKSFAQGISSAPPSITSTTLPSELWQEIALYLDLQDVLTLGLVSKLCREVASIVLRYPHVLGHRLVGVSKELPEYPLQAASFYATRTGIPATVFVGQDTWGTQSRVACFHTWLRVPVAGTLQPDDEGKKKKCAPRGCYR
ncbi:uncharacterized protein EDB93DRAFT_1164234 [Suillus bovinus]|uniref:uncharacterized protein n=1 Tax=Suillus bovinus TaxID=48563 RepID=UPI001B87EB1E|nr:uncharacterized protein EDB93DRAFT_1164234 [Suillus bovinus]KAG2139124.1 hypothetical protein EDB93DRAFT_1164234 [Suillus bovinus]